MRRSLKIVRNFLAALIIIFVIFTAIFIVGSGEIKRHIDGNYESIGADIPAFYMDESTGYYTFIKESGRDFKILQLTDAHIGGGIFSKGKDRKALDAIYITVKETNPDLIIFTGDILYPFPVQSGSINNRRTAKQFARFMEKLQVPWTVSFGNHDMEAYSLARTEWLADCFSLEANRYSVFTKNPKDIEIDGFGNQIINIVNPDLTLNTSLVILDSNRYVNGNMFKYDIIKDSQVEWYVDAITALSNEENGIPEGQVVPSLAFFHVPLNEYRTAWDLYTEGSDEVTYLYGVKDEEILDPAVDDKLPKGKLFDEMVKLNSTKATFCGHNHKNNFAIVLEGIQLSYGNSIVYLGLFGIDKTDDYRGGTLITISDDSSFKSELIFLRDLIN